MAGQVSPLLVIVGETASGKSAAAIELALKYDGEIICADSRTVYRGMDIGTAKPSAEEQARVRHHLLDVVDPDQVFTAAEFKRLALGAIDDIAARGKLPIMAGGTGLYVDAVLYDYQFRNQAKPRLREELNSLSVHELQQKLVSMDLSLPENERNPRHLIRAIETAGQAPEKASLRSNTLIYGVAPDRETLATRITERTEHMLAAGLENEARELAVQYGWEAPGMHAIGYREWHEYFDGTQNLDQTKALIIKNTMAYAKRQRTWFRRNNSIQWCDNREELVTSVDKHTTLLNN